MCVASGQAAINYAVCRHGTGRRHRHVQGTVTDPSGAVVVGATVTAINVATGVESTRKTSEAAFLCSLLPAGEYTVTVKATGFETLTQAHVIVDALSNVAVNPRLQVGVGQPDDYGVGAAHHPEDRRCGARLLG